MIYQTPTYGGIALRSEPCCVEERHPLEKAKTVGHPMRKGPADGFLVVTGLLAVTWVAWKYPNRLLGFRVRLTQTECVATRFETG